MIYNLNITYNEQANLKRGIRMYTSGIACKCVFIAYVYIHEVFNTYVCLEVS